MQQFLLMIRTRLWRSWANQVIRNLVRNITEASSRGSHIMNMEEITWSKLDILHLQHNSIYWGTACRRWTWILCINSICPTIWWALHVTCFCGCQVAGGCWYVLAIQRVAACLQQQCEKNNNCNLVSLACSKEVCYHLPLASGMNNLSCEGDLAASIGMQNTPVCLNADGPFPYGIYNWALPVVSSNSLVVKILYPIFWGLMTLR